ANATLTDRERYTREPVHAGPFAVAAWLPGYGVTLSAFPRYALGAPGLGRIEVRFFPDRAALLDAAIRGDVDVVPAGPLEADLAPTLDRIADGSERARLLAYYTPADAIEMLRFATRGTRFGDVRVRRAVELAIDRQGIVEKVLAGRSRVPGTFLVPPHWAATVSGQPPRADRDAARALLAAAGFTRGPIGVLERGGERMVMPLFVAAGSATRSAAAQFIAADLAAVGIAVEVRERPVADVRAMLARGDYDLALLPEDTADPWQAAARYVGVGDPWFDVLAVAARAGDRAEQRAVYAALQRIWSADLPGLPVYQRLAVDLAPRTLGGVQPASAGAPVTWNASDWRYSR
ncbi:MAG: hypothetical protein FJ034_02900, partial [Chloroflexi bacterium]|nr:hypothetical protein [Chloroflexota bacterium]